MNISNQLEKKKGVLYVALRKKIGVFLGLIMILFGLLSLGISADEKKVDKFEPTWNTEVYDRKWVLANVDYWNVYSKSDFGFVDVTTSYIRITDTAGELINDITRLECQYKIGGEVHTVNEELEDSKWIYLDAFSKKGHFEPFKNDWLLHYMDTVEGHNYWLFKDSEHPYQKCNYQWWWKHKVTDIIYLYVWYIDPTTGEEVAGSFFPNGEHPKYDENGVLEGIFDLNDQLIPGATMDKDGMIIESSTMEPLLTPDDQMKGSVEDSIGNPFDGIISGITDAKNGLDKFVLIVKLVGVIVLSCLLLFFVVFVVLKIKKWWKEAR